MDSSPPHTARRESREDDSSPKKLESRQHSFVEELQALEQNQQLLPDPGACKYELEKPTLSLPSTYPELKLSPTPKSTAVFELPSPPYSNGSEHTTSNGTASNGYATENGNHLEDTGGKNGDVTKRVKLDSKATENLRKSFDQTEDVIHKLLNYSDETTNDLDKNQQSGEETLSSTCLEGDASNLLAQTELIERQAFDIVKETLQSATIKVSSLDSVKREVTPAAGFKEQNVIASENKQNNPTISDGNGSDYNNQNIYQSNVVTENTIINASQNDQSLDIVPSNSALPKEELESDQNKTPADSKASNKSNFTEEVTIISAKKDSLVELSKSENAERKSEEIEEKLENLNNHLEEPLKNQDKAAADSYQAEQRKVAETIKISTEKTLTNEIHNENGLSAEIAVNLHQKQQQENTITKPLQLPTKINKQINVSDGSVEKESANSPQAEQQENIDITTASHPILEEKQVDVPEFKTDCKTQKEDSTELAELSSQTNLLEEKSTDIQNNLVENETKPENISSLVCKEGLQLSTEEKETFGADQKTSSATATVEADFPTEKDINVSQIPTETKNFVEKDNTERDSQKEAKCEKPSADTNLSKEKTTNVLENAVQEVPIKEKPTSEATIISTDVSEVLADKNVRQPTDVTATQQGTTQSTEPASLSVDLVKTETQLDLSPDTQQDKTTSSQFPKKENPFEVKATDKCQTEQINFETKIDSVEIHKPQTEHRESLSTKEETPESSAESETADNLADKGSEKAKVVELSQTLLSESKSDVNIKTETDSTEPEKVHTKLQENIEEYPESLVQADLTDAKQSTTELNNSQEHHRGEDSISVKKEISRQSEVEAPDCADLTKNTPTSDNISENQSLNNQTSPHSLIETVKLDSSQDKKKEQKPSESSPRSTTSETKDHPDLQQDSEPSVELCKYTEDLKIDVLQGIETLEEKVTELEKSAENVKAELKEIKEDMESAIKAVKHETEREDVPDNIMIKNYSEDSTSLGNDSKENIRKDSIDEIERQDSSKQVKQNSSTAHNAKDLAAACGQSSSEISVHANIESKQCDSSEADDKKQSRKDSSSSNNEPLSEAVQHVSIDVKTDTAESKEGKPVGHSRKDSVASQDKHEFVPSESSSQDRKDSPSTSLSSQERRESTVSTDESIPRKESLSHQDSRKSSNASVCTVKDEDLSETAHDYTTNRSVEIENGKFAPQDECKNNIIESEAKVLSAQKPESSSEPTVQEKSICDNLGSSNIPCIELSIRDDRGEANVHSETVSIEAGPASLDNDAKTISHETDSSTNKENISLDNSNRDKDIDTTKPETQKSESTNDSKSEASEKQLSTDSNLSQNSAAAIIDDSKSSTLDERSTIENESRQSTIDTFHTPADSLDDKENIPIQISSDKEIKDGKTQSVDEPDRISQEIHANSAEGETTSSVKSRQDTKSQAAAEDENLEKIETPSNFAMSQETSKTQEPSSGLQNIHEATKQIQEDKKASEPTKTEEPLNIKDQQSVSIHISQPTNTESEKITEAKQPTVSNTEITEEKSQNSATVKMTEKSNFADEEAVDKEEVEAPPYAEDDSTVKLQDNNKRNSVDTNSDKVTHTHLTDSVSAEKAQVSHEKELLKNDNEKSTADLEIQSSTIYDDLTIENLQENVAQKSTTGEKEIVKQETPVTSTKQDEVTKETSSKVEEAELSATEPEVKTSDEIEIENEEPVMIAGSDEMTMSVTAETCPSLQMELEEATGNADSLGTNIEEKQSTQPTPADSQESKPISKDEQLSKTESSKEELHEENKELPTEKEEIILESKTELSLAEKDIHQEIKHEKEHEHVVENEANKLTAQIDAASNQITTADLQASQSQEKENILELDEKLPEDKTNEIKDEKLLHEDEHSSELSDRKTEEPSKTVKLTDPAIESKQASETRTQVKDEPSSEKEVETVIKEVTETLDKHIEKSEEKAAEQHITNNEKIIQKETDITESTEIGKSNTEPSKTDNEKFDITPEEAKDAAEPKLKNVLENEEMANEQPLKQNETSLQTKGDETNAELSMTAEEKVEQEKHIVDLKSEIASESTKTAEEFLKQNESSLETKTEEEYLKANITSNEKATTVPEEDKDMTDPMSKDVLENAKTAEEEALKQNEPISETKTQEADVEQSLKSNEKSATMPQEEKDIAKPKSEDVSESAVASNEEHLKQDEVKAKKANVEPHIASDEKSETMPEEEKDIAEPKSEDVSESAAGSNEEHFKEDENCTEVKAEEANVEPPITSDEKSTIPEEEKDIAEPKSEDLSESAAGSIEEHLKEDEKCIEIKAEEANVELPITSDEKSTMPEEEKDIAEPKSEDVSESAAATNEDVVAKEINEETLVKSEAPIEQQSKAIEDIKPEKEKPAAEPAETAVKSDEAAKKPETKEIKAKCSKVPPSPKKVPRNKMDQPSTSPKKTPIAPPSPKKTPSRTAPSGSPKKIIKRSIESSPKKDTRTDKPEKAEKDAAVTEKQQNELNEKKSSEITHKPRSPLKLRNVKPRVDSGRTRSKGSKTPDAQTPDDGTEKSFARRPASPTKKSKRATAATRPSRLSNEAPELRTSRRAETRARPKSAAPSKYTAKSPSGENGPRKNFIMENKVRLQLSQLGQSKPETLDSPKTDTGGGVPKSTSVGSGLSRVSKKKRTKSPTKETTRPPWTNFFAR